VVENANAHAFPTAITDAVPDSYVGALEAAKEWEGGRLIISIQMVRTPS
jgi:hypothetical protein